jgi:hypothetical protein
LESQLVGPPLGDDHSDRFGSKYSFKTRLENKIELKFIRRLAKPFSMLPKSQDLLIFPHFGSDFFNVTKRCKLSFHNPLVVANPLYQH